MQFLRAMVGVASMTVAINPADNSLIVVIELPLWMQQTKRDRCSRHYATVRKYLRIAARVPASIVSVRDIITDRCSVIAPTDQANGFHCPRELKSRAIATVRKHLPFVVAFLHCSDGGISGAHSLPFGSVRKNGKA